MNKAKTTLHSFTSWSIPVMCLVASSCANIVAPTGGPKDTKPPVLVSAVPENGTTQFKYPTIILTFDEYVILKDESRNIIINPPLEQPPEYKVKGKSVIITMKEVLKENTTYTFTFGNAIQDFTENNPMVDFRYIFSTGPQLDSLFLSGVVLKAENLSPVPKALVMLYRDDRDSIKLTDKPAYIAFTKDNGSFRLENLASASYKVIACIDLNANLLADLPTEEIGFSPQSIRPAVKQVKDSLAPDSLQVSMDVTPLEVRLFKQKDTTLRSFRAYFDKPYSLMIPFSGPVKTATLRTIASSQGLPGDWCREEWSEKRDTLRCWVQTGLYTDSLHLLLDYGGKKPDTLNLDLRYYGKGVLIKKDELSKGKIKPIINASGTLHLKQDLVVTLPYPLKDTSGLRPILVEGKDTLKIKPEPDPKSLRRLNIRYPWKQNTYYSLVLPKGQLKDWLGQTNDSIVWKLNTLSEEDYGTLVLRFSTNRKEPVLLQLMNDKDKVLFEKRVLQSSTWQLKYLVPGDYRLRAVADKNDNSHWDGGNYQHEIQPEEVLNFPNTLKIRGNWEIEESWAW